MKIKAILANSALFVIVIILLELSLRLISTLNIPFKLLITPQYIIEEEKILLDDEERGKIPNPNRYDHDNLGYRNKHAYKSAYAVTLGDSQTYGTGVLRSSSWPKQLERFMGGKIYSMAIPQQGPTKSLLLMNDAIRLTPKYILYALYYGNDLFENYTSVYYYPHLFDKFNLKDKNKNILPSASQDEDSLMRMVNDFYKRPISHQEKEVNEEEEGGIVKIKYFLRKNILLYGILAKVKTAIYKMTDKQKPVNTSWLKEEYQERFLHDGYETVLTSKYRYKAQNINQIKLREGFDIGLKSLLLMAEICKKHGIEFIVLFIPTKEFVFAELFERFKLKKSDDHLKLLAMESLLKEKTLNFLNQHKINWIDASPALSKAFSLGYQPYQKSEDGHPNHEGHKLIAETVADTIRDSKKISAGKQV